MAKKEEKPKTVLERVYNVPLRKEFQKVPKWKRTKKGVKALREFIAKHMKSENVKIGKYLNLELWKHGIKNPPHHVKVKANKDDRGEVFVELAELPKEAVLEMEKAEKEAKKKEKKAKEEEKKGVEEKVEEAKEEKSEEAKKIEKEELKELKKEMPKIKAPKQPTEMPKQVEQRPTAPQQK